MAYDYAVYNLQDEARSKAAHEAIDAMEAAGWDVHTANCNFAELCILWYKPKEKPADSEPDEGKHAKGRTATRKSVSPE